MPPPAEHALSLQKTSSVTKFLRSRDVPLLSLIATARKLNESIPSNIFFPRRDEWLLEWLVQRLREEEGKPGIQARMGKECWRFLGSLLQAVEPTGVAGTLKRHGIIPTVGKAMEEIKTAEDEPGEMVSGLLDEMVDVIQLLQRMALSESAIAASIKSTPEMCAGILGAFLEICCTLLGRGVWLKQSWVETVVELWKGSIWGNADSRKTSGIWSEKCLKAAARLLVAHNAEDALKRVIESMIAEHIFSPKIIFPASPDQKKTVAKPSTQDIIPLLAPLKEVDIGTSTLASLPYLPAIFRISIESQAQRRSKADPLVIGVLFTALLSVSPRLNLKPEHTTIIDADMITSLLQVLKETGTSLTAGTLSRIVRQLANFKSEDPTAVRWSLVATVLAVDFDSFLHPSVSDLTSDLFSALSRATLSGPVNHVFELIVDGFVKARDMVGFIDRWEGLLKRAEEDDAWRGDAVARVFGKNVESSLTSPAILRIANRLRSGKQWVILDAVLRGVRREDTEAQLLLAGALEEIVETARHEEWEWRAWRVLARIGSIKPQLLVPAINDATWLLRADDRWKVAVFASEVMVRVAEETGDESALEGVQALVALTVESLKKCHRWDGRIETIDDTNFGLAVAMAISGGHLTVLEMMDGSYRNQFVDSLFHSALAAGGFDVDTVDARQICQALVGRPELYEYPVVKDTILSALLSNLSPFSKATGDMSSAISKLPSTTPEDVVRYNFIISCLLQYPLESLQRPHREKILDTCLLLDVAGCLTVRPLMHKLWKVGNAGSFMATNCQAIKSWFRHHGAAHTFRRLLTHAFVNRDQEKTKEFLVGLLSMTSSIIKGCRGGNRWGSGELELCWVVITEFWKYRLEIEGGPENLVDMRKEFLGQLTVALDSRKRGARSLGYWRDIWELERDDRDVAEKLAVVVAGKTTAAWTKDKKDLAWAAAPDRVVEVVGLLCSVAGAVGSVMNVTAFVLVALDRLRCKLDAEADEILRHYKATIDRLDVLTHREITRQVIEASLSPEASKHIWSLVKMLVNGVRKPDTPEELSISIDTFSLMHSHLLLALPSSSSPVAFLAIADCINTLLLSHSWIIIQHNLDTTVASITLCASPLGPNFMSEDTDALYLSLTTILSSILAFYRHRVRGRYHLVVALLQHLLTLLFIPKLSRRKTERATHPPWLLPPHNRPLSCRSARSFARVLQTFCDPPVSTVRTHRSELTDSEKSKEKKLVGNVVGPVLECFAKRVLEEQIDPDVRREVVVGIETVLEVLGREGVRRATGRMSTDGRAVVRGLWTEFGKSRGEKV